MLSNRRAFTLLEIMIVVLIMGILLAIAVPNWISSRASSQKNGCISSLKQVDAAKEQWAMDNKKDTGALPAWADLTPGYIRSQPDCPAGGAYSINAIGTLPTCTIAGHVLQ